METCELNDRIRLITGNIEISTVNKLHINQAIYNLATEFYLSRCNHIVDEIAGYKYEEAEKMTANWNGGSAG